MCIVIGPNFLIFFLILQQSESIAKTENFPENKKKISQAFNIKAQAKFQFICKILLKESNVQILYLQQTNLSSNFTLEIKEITSGKPVI